MHKPKFRYSISLAIFVISAATLVAAAFFASRPESSPRKPVAHGVKVVGENHVHQASQPSGHNELVAETAATHEALTQTEQEPNGPSRSDIYKANIALAQIGDADSQYRVHRVLRECNAGAKNTTDIDNIAASAAAPVEFIDALRHKLESCRELFQLVPESAEAETLWLEKSVENGSPLAKARWLTLRHQESNQQEVGYWIKEALKSGDTEAYQYAAIYLARRAEQGADPLPSIALSLLSCAHTDDCDAESYQYQLSREYPAHDFARIEELVAQLPRLIEQNSFSEFGM